MPEANVHTLREGQTRLRTLLRGSGTPRTASDKASNAEKSAAAAVNADSSVRAVLRAWLREIDEKTPRVGASGPAPPDVKTVIYEDETDDNFAKEETNLNALTSVAANIQAHMLWLYRSASVADLTEQAIGDILGAQFFLTTRHTWNNGILQVPETEVFEIIQKLRRAIVAWLGRARGPFVEEDTRASVTRILSGIYRATLGEALDKLADYDESELVVCV